MADINNTKQLNYSAEDINSLLNKVENLKESSIDTDTLKLQIILEVLEKVLLKSNIYGLLISKVFHNNYTPVGNYLFLNDIITVNYTSTEDIITLSINDFEAFIESLHDSGLVETLLYNDVDFTWDNGSYINSSGESITNSISLDFSIITTLDQYTVKLKLDETPINYLITKA